jgi:hypothetical protein
MQRTTRWSTAPGEKSGVTPCRTIRQPPAYVSARGYHLPGWGRRPSLGAVPMHRQEATRDQPADRGR